MDKMRKNSESNIIPSPEPSENKVTKMTECSRVQNHFLFDFSTGELIKVSCKAYKCPECGPRKKFKLQKAIEKYVKSWDRIRMFTFTFSSNIFSGLNMEEKLKLASKIWKTFRDSIRKSHVLTHFEKNFQYIKTIELQENGSPHFHALVDRFIFHSRIDKIWKSAIRQNTDYKGTLGSVNIQGGIRKGDAGKYITKYVTKQLIDIESKYNFRRWSKSGTVTIFEKREKIGDWLFIHLYSSSMSVSSVIEFAIYQRELKKKAPNLLFCIQEKEKPPEGQKFEYGAD